MLPKSFGSIHRLLPKSVFVVVSPLVVMCLPLVEVQCLGKYSKKTCLAWSTRESELITLEKACSEVEWLRNLLVDLPLA